MLTEQSEPLKEAAGYLRELSEEEKIQLQCEGRADEIPHLNDPDFFQKSVAQYQLSTELATD